MRDGIVLNSSGREFHLYGAATQKARPQAHITVYILNPPKLFTDSGFFLTGLQKTAVFN